MGTFLNQEQKDEMEIQNERLVLELQTMLEEGRLSKLRGKGATRLLLELKNDDGTYVFYDVLKGPYIQCPFQTLEKRISRIVTGWKKYLTNPIKYLLIEAAYEQAKNAKKSPTALKTVSDLIGFNEDDEQEVKPPVSRGTDAILRRAGVVKTNAVRKIAGAKGTGDKRPERADTVHIVAHGQEENPSLETVSCADDKSLYVVYSLGDCTEGTVVSDTEGALEDTVDNDSRANMDVA